MKLQYINKSILSTHFLNYQQTLDQNNKLISQTLSDLEVQNLYNKEYQLNEFDIYKYIKALEYISSLGNTKFTLTEGITLDKNKYNNILIDLIYHNIPSDVVNEYPLSILFLIKEIKHNRIEDLTKHDMRN
jgi:hypothetical protein